MSVTGYTAQRATRHDEIVKWMVDELTYRGYDAAELPCDGHRPDIRLHHSTGRGDYLDVKTSQPKHRNLAIEVNSLHTYWNIQREEGRRVYIVHCAEQPNQKWDMHVLLPESVVVLRGPQRHSNGDNSKDDWHLCEPGRKRGTPFDEFFLPLPFSGADMDRSF